jgi:hypothetical protein
LVKGGLATQQPRLQPPGLLLYVWSICERDVNRNPHNTAASLKAEITEVMANLPRDTVVKACRRFRLWIEAVVKAGGNIFK